jgi:hypothetical protein
MRPLGDRRRRIRLEVVGSLWGALEIDRQAQLMNISRTGALIVSPVPAAVDSTQSVKLTIEGHEIKLAARVRHVQRLDASVAPAPNGVEGLARSRVEGPRYRIGLEFLEEPAVLAHAFE